MKKIHLLVLKAYLGPLVATFFIVQFVLMMNFVWRYIDELTGKGLGVSTIAELLACATANMIPHGLPLAMLLSAIMAMGNLGENFELDGEYPYKGLRGDDIPDNLRVAKCSEIIDYIEANDNGKDYRYIIEIKSTGKQGKEAADKLYEIISERNMKDRVIWATFQPDVADYMEKEYPDMPRSADVIEAIQFYFYSRMGWNLDDVNVSYIALQVPYGSSAANLINTGTKAFINYAHKYDIGVQYWTINDAEDSQYLIENGADTIMSDYPDMVFELVEAFK